jgi:hypothetical protein
VVCARDETANLFVYKQCNDVALGYTDTTGFGGVRLTTNSQQLFHYQRCSGELAQVGLQLGKRRKGVHRSKLRSRVTTKQQAPARKSIASR